MCISQLYRQQLKSQPRKVKRAETFKENKTTSLYGSAVVDARATSMWHWWLLLLVNRTCNRLQNKSHRIFKHTYIDYLQPAIQNDEGKRGSSSTDVWKCISSREKTCATRNPVMVNELLRALIWNMQVNCFLHSSVYCFYCCYWFSLLLFVPWVFSPFNTCTWERWKCGFYHFVMRSYNMISNFWVCAVCAENSWSKCYLDEDCGRSLWYYNFSVIFFVLC